MEVYIRTFFYLSLKYILCVQKDLLHNWTFEEIKAKTAISGIIVWPKAVIVDA